ncbi:hypothetical protein [Myxacorys almedinensis]|uniref:Uncharacterized protein n=1 Tax=Myxacorys almedinensis A TaxID=2690445 RepID=A0A8J7Z392_9CYAN|nr:hypothetical protein [Myxacorys almedinensis]NDJ17021.1 hypothetical protein [Myxacorys almedinensis A]
MNSQLSTLDLSDSVEVLPPTEQLLAISEQKKSGLILCKDYHAEFAGPGAAVSCLVEPAYRAVIAIGSPTLAPMVTVEDRRRAYGRRIQWGRWLQRIVEHPESVVRAEKLLAGFEEFFGRQVVVSLPSEVLALLAGVFPGTIEMARSQHWRTTRFDTAAHLICSDQLKVTTISLSSEKQEVHSVPLLTTATVSEIEQTYAVLRSA